MKIMKIYKIKTTNNKILYKIIYKINIKKMNYSIMTLISKMIKIIISKM
jgi:hypothetical protein